MDKDPIILLVIKYPMAYVTAPNKIDMGKAGSAVLFSVRIKIVNDKP